MADAIRAFADAGWFAEMLIILLMGCIIRVTALLINRVLRTIKVSVAGWPPAHIDADGDWRPIEEKAAKVEEPT